MSRARDLASLMSQGNLLQDGVISTTEVDGVTATSAELNKLDGVTANTTELNKLAEADDRLEMIEKYFSE